MRFLKQKNNLSRLSKLVPLKICIISIFIFINSTQFMKVKAKDIRDLSTNCINSSQFEKCIIALDYLESLQLTASSSDSYKCQTQLLGLEMHLVMSLLKVPQRRNALNMISTVERTCTSN